MAIMYQADIADIEARAQRAVSGLLEELREENIGLLQKLYANPDEFRAAQARLDWITVGSEELRTRLAAILVDWTTRDSVFEPPRP
jgi:hypothetical protein